MIRATILLMFLIVAFVNAGPSSQSLSASVKDTSVNGLEGLNLKWTVPFKVQDYTVGFKYSLADLKKVPDSLFAKRSFDAGNGVATVNADYDIADKTLGVCTNWSSEKDGVSIGISANSKDRVTEVRASTAPTIGGNKVDIKGTWDRIKNSVGLSTKTTVDDITAQVDYDTTDKNPVLSVSYKLDANNVVTPAVSLKDGEMSYRWNRKINGGNIDAKLKPGNTLDVEWQDNGSNGQWATKASIPVNNPSGSKVSFSREWNV